MPKSQKSQKYRKLSGKNKKVKNSKNIKRLGKNKSKSRNNRKQKGGRTKRKTRKMRGGADCKTIYEESGKLFELQETKKEIESLNNNETNLNVDLSDIDFKKKKTYITFNICNDPSIKKIYLLDLLNSTAAKAVRARRRAQSSAVTARVKAAIVKAKRVHTTTAPNDDDEGWGEWGVSNDNPAATLAAATPAAATPAAAPTLIENWNNFENGKLTKFIP